MTKRSDGQEKMVITIFIPIIDHALHMGIGRSRLVQGLLLSPSAIGRE